MTTINSSGPGQDHAASPRLSDKCKGLSPGLTCPTAPGRTPTPPHTPAFPQTASRWQRKRNWGRFQLARHLSALGSPVDKSLWPRERPVGGPGGPGGEETEGPWKPRATAGPGLPSPLTFPSPPHAKQQLEDFMWLACRGPREPAGAW